MDGLQAQSIPFVNESLLQILLDTIEYLVDADENQMLNKTLERNRKIVWTQSENIHIYSLACTKAPDSPILIFHLSE